MAIGFYRSFVCGHQFLIVAWLTGPELRDWQYTYVSTRVDQKRCFFAVVIEWDCEYCWNCCRYGVLRDLSNRLYCDSVAFPVVEQSFMQIGVDISALCCQMFYGRCIDWKMTVQLIYSEFVLVRWFGFACPLWSGSGYLVDSVPHRGVWVLHSLLQTNCQPFEPTNPSIGVFGFNTRWRRMSGGKALTNAFLNKISELGEESDWMCRMWDFSSFRSWWCCVPKSFWIWKEAGLLRLLRIASLRFE